MATVTKERRSSRLVARVSGNDKELLSRAAALQGMSVATFVISHARDVARQVVSRADEVNLNAAQSRRFVEALLKPSPSVPSRLRNALKEHRSKVTG